MRMSVRGGMRDQIWVDWCPWANEHRCQNALRWSAGWRLINLYYLQFLMTSWRRIIPSLAIPKKTIRTSQEERLVYLWMSSPRSVPIIRNPEAAFWTRQTTMKHGQGMYNSFLLRPTPSNMTKWPYNKNILYSLFVWNSMHTQRTVRFILYHYPSDVQVEAKYSESFKCAIQFPEGG